MDMRWPRVELAEIILDIPHSPLRSGGYVLKRVDRSIGFYGAPPQGGDDVSARYRGRLFVRRAYLSGEVKPVNGRIRLGGYTFRVVDELPYFDQFECVLENRLAFISVWQRRAYRAWLNIAWRLLATLRIWGLAKRWDATEIASVVDRNPWRSVYAIDWLVRKLERRPHA